MNECLQSSFAWGYVQKKSLEIAIEKNFPSLQDWAVTYSNKTRDSACLMMICVYITSE